MEELTWKPTAAGIFDIVSGISGLIGGLVLALLAVAAASFIPFIEVEEAAIAEVLFGAGLVLFGFLALLCFGGGVVALWGGVHAMRRTGWGWAVAGSIASVLIFFPLGVLAVIFTVMAEKEFAAPAAPVQA